MLSADIPFALREYAEPKMADAIRKNLHRLVKAEKKIHPPAPKKSSPKPNPARKRASTAAVQLNGPPVISSLPKLRSKIDMRPGPNHNSVRVSIVDYIGPIVLPDIAPSRGDILFTQTFSPARIQGSKMATISTMYERYVVNRLIFHYSAACPTTVGGALIMAFDKDPADTTFAGEPGIRHAVGLSSMTQFAPWEHASLLVEKENQQTFYYTSTTDAGGDTDRLEYMGALFVLASSPGTLIAEQSIGDLWVEAEVTFFDPTWEPTDVSGVVEQPTDSAHTMSLVSLQGFIGTENDSVVTETNLTYEPTGIVVGMETQNPGFVVYADNRYYVTDQMIGLLSTVRITGEVLTAYPLGPDRRVRPDAASHAIPFTSTFESSDTSATQTNWAANFTVVLPGTIFDDVGWHYVSKWYIMSSLVGTVGGTYTGRNITLQRDAGFQRTQSISRRKVIKYGRSGPAPPLNIRTLPPPKKPQTKVSDGKTEVSEPGKSGSSSTTQWLKLQIASDSQ